MLGLVAVGAASSFCLEARADDPPKPTTSAGGPAEKAQVVGVDQADKRPEGWTPGIAIGGLFNLVDTRNVVGSQDGTALSLGAAIDAELLFNHGIHEWRNTLALRAGATRTPSIGEFVKTADDLEFESIYLVHLLEWFGPFARAAVRTSMFPSLDIRPTPQNYAVTNLDGTVTDFTGTRLALTGAFRPTTFKESIGVFFQPVKNDHITFEGRAGFGAQETLAANQLAIIGPDKADPNVLDVDTLRDSYEIGGELVANAWGAIDNDKRVSYAAGVDVLFPFVHSDLAKGDSRNLADLITVEATGALNFRIFDWASLDYKLNVLRQPLVIDEVQVTNTLLLTIGAAWGSKAPVPPPPKCDCTKLPPPPAPDTPAQPTPAPAASTDLHPATVASNATNANAVQPAH